MAVQEPVPGTPEISQACSLTITPPWLLPPCGPSWSHPPLPGLTHTVRAPCREGMLAESSWHVSWGMPGKEGLGAPMLPTSPAPHTAVCSQRKQQLGLNTRPRGVLVGPCGKLQPTPLRSLKTKLFVFPTAICGQGAHPPPSRAGSELETEQSSQHCGYTPASWNPGQTRPAYNPAHHANLAQARQANQPNLSKAAQF